MAAALRVLGARELPEKRKGRRRLMDAVTLTTSDGLNLFGMLGTVLWHMLRIGAAFQVMPVFGGRTLPMTARLLLTIALAAAISTVLPAPPAAAVDAATVLNVIREFAVGIAIGLILRLAFEAGQLAGEMVSQGMGLAFATLADPLSGRFVTEPFSKFEQRLEAPEVVGAGVGVFHW